MVGNQGFDNGERDPKVFWHEASGRWVMFLWVQRDPGRVRIFTSSNLTDWEVASDLMRDWAYECMDVIFLPLDGDRSKTKAVVYDASFDYEVGTFDGREFRTEAGPFRAGSGNFYAAQTFNNAPDGRVVQIGWMRGGPNSAKVYGLPFNQQMSFPCELTLRTTNGQPRLFAWPVDEIESLVASKREWRDVALAEGVNLLAGLEPFDLVDCSIEFEPGTARRVVFELAGAKLWYDSQGQKLLQTGVDDRGQPVEITVFENLRPRNARVQLRLLIDRLSVESYAFGGEQFAAHYRPPPRRSRSAPRAGRRRLSTRRVADAPAAQVGLGVGRAELERQVDHTIAQFVRLCAGGNQHELFNCRCHDEPTIALVDRLPPRRRSAHELPPRRRSVVEDIARHRRGCSSSTQSRRGYCQGQRSGSPQRSARSWLQLCNRPRSIRATHAYPPIEPCRWHRRRAGVFVQRW